MKAPSIHGRNPAVILASEPDQAELTVACQNRSRLRLAQTVTCALLFFAAARQTPANAGNVGDSASASGGAKQEETAAISAQIQQSEYEIHWQSAAGAYMAPNRAHNLRFTFHDDGLTITPREAVQNQSPWAATMRLASYGRLGYPVRRIGVAAWAVAGNTAHDNAGGITIDYKNDSSGLRQDFLIRERPPGSGPLRLEFGLNASGANITFDPAQNAMYLTIAQKPSKVIMRYRDLHVFDSERMPLKARMEQVCPGRFAIVVDDAEARYPVLIDPTLENDGYLQDPQAGSLFGQSVAYVAEVYFTAGGTGEYGNHLGVAVGAPYFDSGSVPNAGAVYYYDAGWDGSLSTTPTWSYAGGGSNEFLGWSVADGGANNSIGGIAYHNILVGAPGFSHEQTNEGAAMAFYYDSNAASYPSSPSWIYYGGNAGENFGWSVAGNVDFAGSGSAGVIVGAPYFTNWLAPYYPIGQVRVFSGSTSGYSNTPAWTGYGESFSEFGYSVDWGNVQGTGPGTYPALLVGAPGASAVYEFLNPSGALNTSADATLTGSGRFGSAIASRQDQNGDGYHDLLVGDPNATYDSMAEAGMAYLFRGGSSGLSTTAAWSLGGDGTNANFGASVALGDMNGDGLADIIIGEPNMSTTSQGLTQNGYVDFYLTDFNTYLPDYEATIEGQFSGVQMGTSVAYAPSLVYQDADIIAGAPGADASTSPSVAVMKWP